MYARSVRCEPGCPRSFTVLIAVGRLPITCECETGAHVAAGPARAQHRDARGERFTAVMATIVRKLPLGHRWSSFRQGLGMSRRTGWRASSASIWLSEEAGVASK